jgi:DNA-directed RNA polymerase specialized sigma24 family protein
VRSGGQDDDRFVASGQSPSKEFAVRDMLQEVHRRLSVDERRILELRNEGCDWTAIATELGGSAEALRRKLSRALNRVGEQLGLDGVP